MHNEPLKTGDTVVFINYEWSHVSIGRELTIARETKTMLIIGIGEGERRFYKKDNSEVGGGTRHHNAARIFHTDSPEAHRARLTVKTREAQGEANTLARTFSQALRPTMEQANDLSIALDNYRAALKARDQITELLGAPAPAAPPQAVLKFINERPGYITACENSRNSDADYWRWQGNAAARRMLAASLGYTVPHHRGDTTKPKD